MDAASTSDVSSGDGDVGGAPSSGGRSSGSTEGDGEGEGKGFIAGGFMRVRNMVMGSC